MKTKLQKAIEILGSQTALAKQCGVKQQHIHYWLHHLGYVPAEHVIRIEKATNGKVTRYELRPDIYPRE